MIPEKTDQAANRKKCGSRGGRPVSHDAALYKERNTAERCISKIKEWARAHHPTRRTCPGA
ncbi:hypothetical protein GCM10010350_82770 [Streptomyces galilaeus]|nr:hypothetical protein GCM10010350_82770 [Streptomyces galilaeus]